MEAFQLSHQWATHVVSLLDPDMSNLIRIPIASQDSLQQRYYFHDITPNQLEEGWLKNAKVATLEQIQDILAFTAPLQSSHKLLVHCHAGISRSTAVACGILCQHGLTPQEAVKYVLSIRKQAFPNQHILALFDNALKLEGKLIAAGNLREIARLSRDNGYY